MFRVILEVILKYFVYKWQQQANPFAVSGFASNSRRIVPKTFKCYSLVSFVVFSNKSMWRTKGKSKFIQSRLDSARAVQKNRCSCNGNFVMQSRRLGFILHKNDTCCTTNARRRKLYTSLRTACIQKTATKSLHG